MQNSNNDKVALPYSVAVVLKEQQQILKSAYRKYVGKKFLDKDLKTFAIYLQWKCKRQDIPLSFFLSSLDTFRYRTVTEQELQQFLVRLVSVLALNETPLQPVEPWLLQDKDEWVPVEVLAVTQEADQFVYIFVCKALCSRMAGQVFSYRVSIKMAFRMASRAGFNQRSELKRMVDPRQFVDLRLVLQVAKGSAPDRVKVLDCGEHPATVEYNRKINKQRDPEFRKCPFRQQTTCFQCMIGKDRCKLAVTEKGRIVFNSVLDKHDDQKTT